MGVPSAVAVVADNQRAGVEAAARRGLVRALGGHAALREEDVARALGELARDPGPAAAMSALGRATVDGLGAARVCEALSLG